MLNNVRAHLQAKGIDPSVLDDMQDDQGSVEEGLEVDALTDALDALTKAMKKEPKKEMNLFDDEDMDDEDMDDEDEEEMSKAEIEEFERAYYQDAMKALAKGTDSIVEDMEKRMSAIMKGLEAMMNEMKGMRAKNDEMSKSLNSVLSQSSAPRAVVSASPVATPEFTGPTRQDVIRKGLKMLQGGGLDNHKKSAVRGAIAQLEAGVPVASVTHIIDLD